MKRKGLDWPALYHIAFRYLRMKPHEFWALTPLELLANYRACFGEADALRPAARAELEEMMRAHPDR